MFLQYYCSTISTFAVTMVIITLGLWNIFRFFFNVFFSSIAEMIDIVIENIHAKKKSREVVGTVFSL